MTNPNHPARKRLLDLHILADRFIGHFADGNPHAAKAEQALYDAFAPVRLAVVWEEENNPDCSSLTSSQVEDGNYQLRRNLDPEFKREEDELDAKLEEYLRKKEQEQGEEDA